MMRPVLGGPGVSDERQWAHKHVFRGSVYDCIPGGGWIDVTKSRDVWSTDTGILQPGLFMGQTGVLSTTQKWAPSFFGKTTAVTLHGGTTVTVGTAQATEIVRRVGSTGSLNIVGPSVTGGPAKVGRLTYSAVNTGTGAITVTGTGQNETQLLNIAGTPSAGTFRLLFVDAYGNEIATGTIAHNATFATVITNINTALDAVFGTGAIVASGSAYTAITLTHTTGGFAVTNASLAYADVGALTGATQAGTSVSEVNPGYYGTFAVGSLIGATDGSFYPKSFIPPGYGLQAYDGTSNTPIGDVVQYPWIPYTGIPEWLQLAPTVTEPGIRKWLADQMSGNAPALGGGTYGYGARFTFPDFYNSAS